MRPRGDLMSGVFKTCSEKLVSRFVAFILTSLFLVTLHPQPSTALEPSAPEFFKSVSMGAKHTCAISSGDSLRCWGWNGQGQTDVPADLGPVAKVSLGDEHTCAISQAGEVRCWGSNGQGQTDVPADLGTAYAIHLGKDRTCAVDSNLRPRCWGGLLSTQNDAPSDLGPVFEVYVRDTHTCAKTGEGTAKCWGKNPPSTYVNMKLITEMESSKSTTCVVRNYQWLECTGRVTQSEQVKEGFSSIAVGEASVCRVSTTHLLRCWGALAAPNNLGPVKSVALGGGSGCAILISNVMRCWGANIYGEANTPYAFVEIPSNPINLVFNESNQTPGSGTVSIEYRNSDSLGDGSLMWTLKNETDKSLCVLAYKERSCVFNGLQLGKQYSFSVQGENEAGKTNTVRLVGETISCLPSRFEMSTSKPLVLTGSFAEFKGRISALCESVPEFYEFRFRESGGAWSLWAKARILPSGEFSLKHKIRFNTAAEFRVKNKLGTYKYFNVAKVRATMKKKNPVSFSYSSTKIKQGFNQGGIVSAKFNGDATYTGSCVIQARTAYALNFASVAVGAEKRTSVFSVKNGYGLGQLKMKWNGKSEATVSCQSARYHDVFAEKEVNLKPNYSN